VSCAKFFENVARDACFKRANYLKVLVKIREYVCRPKYFINEFLSGWIAIMPTRPSTQYENGRIQKHLPVPYDGSVKSISSSPAGLEAAIARAWRRHFSTNSGVRLSGTQIKTGRNPAARIFRR